MCGITGFIGKTKNKELSDILTTSLFEFSESRGTDASGFWSTERSLNGKIIYFKEPTKSSKFIKKDSWKEFLKKECDLLLAHCRYATGLGEPFFNENNHPFVTSNKSLAIIHNGKISNINYYELKERYETNTKCDSEIFLRIIESKINEGVLEGIKEILSFVNEVHMAIAIGQKQIDGTKNLWIFRNEHRPLWICDLRDELGQIFFFSELKIWFEALNKINLRFKSSKIEELPTEEIWNFELKEEIEIKKYNTKKEKYIDYLNKEYFQIKKENKLFEMISNLNEEDQIIKQKEEKINLNSEEIEKLCNELISKVKNIKSIVNKVKENNLEEIKIELLKQISDIKKFEN